MKTLLSSVSSDDVHVEISGRFEAVRKIAVNRNDGNPGRDCLMVFAST